MARPIIHPRSMERLRGHYPSLCTIQLKPTVPAGYGTPVPLPTTVPGKEAIPCAIGPYVLETPTGANEQRGERVTTSTSALAIELNGYYPDIDGARHHAVVDSITYDILGVDSDSFHTFTRLRVEKVGV